MHNTRVLHWQTSIESSHYQCYQIHLCFPVTTCQYICHDRGLTKVTKCLGIIMNNYTYSSQAALQTFASADHVWTWQRCRIVLLEESFFIQTQNVTSSLLQQKLFSIRLDSLPASLDVSVSSYSSRILSSRSFSSLSQIIPTCLRENKGCSFRVGDEAPQDVPVRNTKLIVVSHICHLVLSHS